MKFKIVHESRGRIRVQVIQNRMTLEQADLLEAYLCTWPAAQQVTVHERTCCAIVRYEGDRQELLTFLSRFSYTSTEIAKNCWTPCPSASPWPAETSLPPVPSCSC